MNKARQLTGVMSAVALLSALLLTGVIGTGVVLADTSLHQTGPIAAEEFGNQECGDTEVAPGETLWHFVLTQTTDENTGTLWADFEDANGDPHQVVEHFTKHTGGVLHWDVITPSGWILIDATTDADGALLNLSHVCIGDHPGATAAIVTEIHSGATDSGAPVVIPNGGHVDLGSTVHDSATLTTLPDVDPLPAGSWVTFYFYEDATCDNSFEGDPGVFVDSEAFDVSGMSTASGLTVDPALAQGPLGPGDYSYRAFFTSGDTDIVLNATADCEPFTVDKGDLDIRTDIHNAAHAVVLSVPLGSVVHDTATLSGSVAGFDPDMTKVSFSFYTNGDCEEVGASVANTGTESTFVARSADSAALAAGQYSYSASFAGDDNYNPAGPAACEPLTVEKGDLDIRTDIHNSAHAIVLSVPVGGIVHDTATLSGAVAGFDPDLDEVSFTFWLNGACDGAGAPVANAAPESLYVARTVNSAPLAAGHYSYSASFAGDDNYNPVGPATCEPLSVFQPGKTMGFWGNKNGIARILANGGYAANAVNIGRGAIIDTQAESLKVLPKTLNACGKGNPIIFSDQTVSANCSLASGININSLNTLAAQTLALGYNIKLVAGYDGQTIGDLGCTPVGSLTTSSTVGDAFAAAVALINGSASGGTTTQAQIGAMNTLLGCLNAEA